MEREGRGTLPQRSQRDGEEGEDNEVSDSDLLVVCDVNVPFLSPLESGVKSVLLTIAEVVD